MQRLPLLPEEVSQSSALFVCSPKCAYFHRWGELFSSAPQLSDDGLERELLFPNGFGLRCFSSRGVAKMTSHAFSSPFALFPFAEVSDYYDGIRRKVRCWINFGANGAHFLNKIVDSEAQDVRYFFEVIELK